MHATVLANAPPNEDEERLADGYENLTTPQLHYLTRCLNTKGTPLNFGIPTEQGYYEKLAAALRPAIHEEKRNGSVTVGCANGLAGPKLRELLKYLPDAFEGGIEKKAVNDAENELRSVEQTLLRQGNALLPPLRLSRMARCASLDGDADQIIFYFIDNENTCNY